jgi:putative transposase
MADHGLSVRHACQVASLSRAAYYRPPLDRLDRDAEVIAALTALVTELPQWGFWMCFAALRLAGHPWNWKRVYRVYKALRLNLKRRTKRRVPPRTRQPLDAPAVLNGIWALDFMSDMLYSGTRFRTANVLDEGNREGLAIEIALSLPAVRVVALLDQLVAIHGAPSALRVDNGPELISEELRAWAERQGVRLLHIQPGKPTQNAYIERFNGSYRKEVLDAYLFGSLDDVRAETERWLTIYNTRRPHDSLGRVPPLTFLPRSPVPLESSYERSA